MKAKYILESKIKALIEFVIGLNRMGSPIGKLKVCCVGKATWVKTFERSKIKWWIVSSHWNDINRGF